VEKDVEGRGRGEEDNNEDNDQKRFQHQRLKSGFPALYPEHSPEEELASAPDT
jgi:hypothetical protein